MLKSFIEFGSPDNARLMKQARNYNVLTRTIRDNDTISLSLGKEVCVLDRRKCTYDVLFKLRRIVSIAHKLSNMDTHLLPEIVIAPLEATDRNPPSAPTDKDIRNF